MMQADGWCARLIVVACVGLTVAVCGGVILLVARGRVRLSDRAKRILLGLVSEAEAAFGPGTGDIKLSAVLGRLYALMPAAFGRLFPEETVVSWIEEAVRAMKERMKEIDT